MPIIQISKIQMRRGLANDLPTPSLDDAEFGFTTDTGRLFIGQTSPTAGQPNYNRVVFPYENVEVLTENSPLGALVGPVFNDNQGGYVASTALTAKSSFSASPNLQVYDATHAPQDFYVDVQGNAGNARIDYFLFDTSNNAICNGCLTLVWNTTMTETPMLIDSMNIAYVNIGKFQWSASRPTSHVVLQYTLDESFDQAMLYFRLDRPAL